MALFVAAFASLLVCAFVHAANPARPNIIFVLTDDFGWGDPGCYGGQFVPTPHLDRIAKEGIRFTQFYVTSPICSPSRTGNSSFQSPRPSESSSVTTRDCSPPSPPSSSP